LGHSIRAYERALKVARDKHPKSIEITGDTCLVAVIPQDELAPTTAIIMSSGGTKQVNSLESKRPVLVRVLEIGQGYLKEDGTNEPVDLNIGDILLVGPNSVTEISQFGKLLNYGRVVLGLCNASERLFRWKGDEAFNEYFGTVMSEVNNDQ
jgi:hypothetical protein